MATTDHQTPTLHVGPGDDAGIDVVFQDPTDGSDVRVQIRPYQNDDWGCAYGVGVYFLDDHGEKTHGIGVRWDYGADADPTVIHWQRPHCAEDLCGEPCRHKRAS